MKKSLLSLVLLLGAALFLLNSCDDDNDASLVGTWQADEMTVMFAAGGVGTAPLPDSWIEQLTFNPDGTYSYSWQKDKRSGSGDGTWTLENRELVLVDGGRTERIQYGLNAKYLSLVSPVSQGEAELLYMRQE